jgi:nucleotide-binding universal stress UspA family protein
MYTKILVPLDGSGLAECVFEHVKEIAKGCEAAEVDLLYVVPPFASAFEENTATSDIRIPDGDVQKFGALKYENWGKKYLDGVAQNLTKDGIAAKSIVLRGGPADVNLDYIRDNAFDLVIMSTHGRSGPARWTMGSVTDRVLRQSVSPVMIVRPQECQVTI